MTSIILQYRHLSSDDCLQDNREHQNCSVLCYVYMNVHQFISPLRWATGLSQSA